MVALWLVALALSSGVGVKHARPLETPIGVAQAVARHDATHRPGWRTGWGRHRVHRGRSFLPGSTAAATGAAGAPAPAKPATPPGSGSGGPVRSGVPDLPEPAEANPAPEPPPRPKPEPGPEPPSNPVPEPEPAPEPQPQPEPAPEPQPEPEPAPLPGPTPEPEPVLPTEPTSQTPSIYWGAWIDGDVYGRSGDAPWDATTWDDFEADAGKRVSIVHFGQPAPWQQPFAPGPLATARSRGALGLLDMDPDGATLSDIASGAYDTQLTAWARAAREYGKPFFFRWAWEMNGTWFKWGAEAAADPSVYVAAWRHFHDVVTAQGATNVTWVWCPNTSFKGSTSLAGLYPGDAYVDWTCLDGYNAGTGGGAGASDWRSFGQIFGDSYAELLALAPQKPIMIGETGSGEDGGSKAEWIRDALAELPQDFPQIKALVWFNWNIVDSAGLHNWQIESSPAAQEAFAAAISSPLYASSEFGNLPALRPIAPLP
ncbi:MAG TPA: glycosyl hydrolase [Solirubrobacterales bacterium]|nr:glycosyl hydrolase [Solirubrobacterales bacterium]